MPTKLLHSNHHTYMVNPANLYFMKENK